MQNISDLTDLCTPWCVHTVATLRIAEQIQAGITDIGELAKVAGCDRQALGGVMAHLVTKGLFEQPEPGRFVLNDMARGLLEPGALLGLDLNGIGGRMAYTWST